MTALPHFVRLHAGPTVQWGGEVRRTGGETFVQRFCTLNLWALDENGRVWVLAYDYERPTDAPPLWMRWPDAEPT